MVALIRFEVFLSVFTVMAIWEWLRPQRVLVQPRRERWVTNLGLTLCNSALIWLTVGGVAYAAALFAAEQQAGILYWLAAPPWLAVVVTFLLLDFAIYLQHILFHMVPALWRLHQVHHADLGFDASTGLRFHPFEITLSLAYKVTVVLLLGAVPWVVVMFEVVLNAASVFNHGNVAIPERVDRVLRWVIVTPDMHRIHHSTIVKETNANFGFSLAWWDRLCGTYRAEPVRGQRGLEIGLVDYRTPISFGHLLLLPFRHTAERYTLTGARPVQASLSPSEKNSV